MYEIVHRFEKRKTMLSILTKPIRKLKKKLQKEDFFNEIRKREYYETRNERKRKRKLNFQIKMLLE